MPRIKHDAYMTPPHYVAALLAEVRITGRVYEPCVGDGAIARALGDDADVLTNDIDRQWKADSFMDATKQHAWVHSARGKEGPFDWVVTNPPFSDELTILEHALDHCDNVAFLARLSFLEPTEDREYLLGERPPTSIIVLPRYSFRNNDKGEKATDSVTCCWLVWQAISHGPAITAYGRGRAQSEAILRGLV